ncbi:MarR family winged helix-turn-helix transcriptional regulator [Agrococcus sp. Marseille-P2731]|uniref:MarR family winged helix-turn-helix transcriptional regulator n=1 Tax=Agrococcus sp. Marseille-P2731 TaxID=1841862 RepID=UPI000A519DB6|nr:MarR family transcriptional regulator [Agrococcus sp. Marseille-P2731]
MAPEANQQRVTDQMVCFALYAAARATTQAYRSLLEPWGLTYPQYLVLVTLWVEGPQSVKALGERMQLDSGTLSPLLARMEQGDLVARERGGSDARVVTVRPTERGAALRSEMEGVPAAVARGLGLADGVDGEQLLQTLHGISASMHAVADDPSSVLAAR